MSEYDADKLAEDSDNEKKIEKAEKTAERKAALACKKRSCAQLPSGITPRDFIHYPGPPRKLLEGASAVPIQTPPNPVTECPAQGACFFLWGVWAL